MRFSGKVAVVAGGGQGIGSAIAKALAAEGAHVEVWDLNEAGAESVVQIIEEAGDSARARRVDVLDYAQVEAGVDSVVSDRGALDILVSTVGGGRFRPFDQCTAEFFEQDVRFNLFSVFNCAHAVLPVMVKQDRGSMLFFTSATGGTPNLVGYEAGKAGVESLIHTLVAELTKTKITINAINPGMTDTPLTRREFDKLPDGAQRWAQVAASKPLGINTPEEVARLAAFLVSDDARRLTGQVILSQ